ncbi:hypothetical protein JRO89_XS08G0251300 [Xanthoceras sorbifolium]|uniref:VQ domain-containing protein n=1 Tax=Xanthoceras sorbifolium TaxID=99658 RepID=A0ABQ8HRD4_9ROSI|nr:hypothetical protein JRO89_XS08G0251300 [Xanthoceras sorbifolium]
MEIPASQGAAGCKPITTFVKTDTNTFREVVQRLTGPSEIESAAAAASSTKRQTSKLHERRQYTRPKLEIVKPPINFKPASSPRSSKPGTPTVVTPSTIFSNLSLLEESIFSEFNSQEEEKAIKERRFYLHPSPRGSRPGYTQPELLTLFPLTSPKTADHHKP